MSFHIKFPLTSNPRGLLCCSGDSSGCRVSLGTFCDGFQLSIGCGTVVRYTFQLLMNTGCWTHRMYTAQADSSLSKRLLATCPTSTPNLIWIGIFLDSIQQCNNLPCQWTKVQRIKVKNWRAFYKTLIVQYIIQYNIMA